MFDESEDDMINTFVPNAPFFYSLKDGEKDGVEK